MFDYPHGRGRKDPDGYRPFKTGGTDPQPAQCHIFHSSSGPSHFPVGGCHTFRTGGSGSWMNVPDSLQAPKKQEPPTDKNPTRMHVNHARPK